jgi:hypothetical protein
MRDKALAVDCSAREPDPVLLAQLTALAAASTAPVVKPWWHRFTAKTGAAAVAGVLLISGATADAERGHVTPAPIAVTIVGSTNQARPHHKPVPVAATHSYAAVLPHAFIPMRHAGKRAGLRQRAHSKKKHQDGNSNGGGSGNGQGGVEFFAGLAPLQAFAAIQDAHGHPHSHARQQRAHSHH